MTTATVARSTPVADTDTSSALPATFEIGAGERTYTVTAPGKAQTRVTLSARAGQSRNSSTIARR